MRSTRWALLVVAVALLAVPASASATADITSAKFTRGAGNTLRLTVVYSGTFNADGFYWQLANSDTMSNLSSPTPFCSLYHAPEIGQCSFTSEPSNPFTLSFDTSSFYPDGAGGTIKASTQNALPISGPGAGGGASTAPTIDLVPSDGTRVLVDEKGKAVLQFDPQSEKDFFTTLNQQLENDGIQGSSADMELAMFFAIAPGFRSADAAKKGRTVKGGSVTGTLLSGQRSKLTLRLNGKGRKALASKGKLRVNADGTGGAKGVTVPVHMDLRLVPKKSKK